MMSQANSPLSIGIMFSVRTLCNTVDARVLLRPGRECLLRLGSAYGH